MKRGRYRCRNCGEAGHNAKKCKEPPSPLPPELQCRCGARVEQGKKSCTDCLFKQRMRVGQLRGRADIVQEAREKGHCQYVGRTFACTNPGWPLPRGRVFCFQHLPRSHPERKQICPKCRRYPLARGWKLKDGGWIQVTYRSCRKCWYKADVTRRENRQEYDRSRMREGRLRWPRDRRFLH